MPKSKSFRDAERSAAAAIVVEGGTTAEDRPDYKCASYVEAEKKRKIIRDVYGGTDRLRECGKTYLPQWEGEDYDTDYKDRLAGAILFDALSHTVGGLVGMVTRKDPVLGDKVPKKLEEYAWNIDNAGRPLSVFAKDIFTDAMLDGISFIHVDKPPVPTGVKWKSHVPPGLRPYWIDVKAHDLVNWNWEIVQGAPSLTLAVYRETVSVEKGRFGQKTITRYRELRPGYYVVWEEQVHGNDVLSFVPIEEGEVSLPYIPLFPCYTNRTGYMEADPLLMGLAHQNLRHYRVDSEHDHARSIASTPMAFFKGCEVEDAMKFGAHYALLGKEEWSDAKWIETTGSSLNQTRTDLKDIEARMAFLGMSLLIAQPSPQPGGEGPTATGDLIRKSEGDATLMGAAKGLEMCLQNALDATAEFEGEAGGGGTVTVNTDFHAQMMSPQMAAFWSGEVDKGHMSLETFWTIMQEGEQLSEDFNPEAELDKLDEPDDDYVTERGEEDEEV